MHATQQPKSLFPTWNPPRLNYSSALCYWTPSGKTFEPTRSWTSIITRRWRSQCTNQAHSLRVLFSHCLMWVMLVCLVNLSHFWSSLILARMHIKGGYDHRFCPCAVESSCTTRLGSAPPYRRDGLHRSVRTWSPFNHHFLTTNTKRTQLTVHPRINWQEVRTSLQGRRRPCIPLHPAIQLVQGQNTRRIRKATCSLAPEFACFCTKVFIRFFYFMPNGTWD